MGKIEPMSEWGNNYDLDSFLRESQAQLNRYGQHRERFETLAKETQQRQHNLENQQAESYAALASALLPSIDDENSVRELAQRLGLPELPQIYTTKKQSETRIANSVAAIDANDTYINRDLRRLQLESHRNELQPLLDHAEKEWQKLIGLERLPHLIECGYGTEEYQHRSWWRFFNKEFLEDWRCSDAAVEALGVPSFLEVRVQYQDRAEQKQVLERSMREIEDAEKTITDLEQERENLLAEQQALPKKTYQAMGERIAAQLQNGNSPLLQTLANQEAIRSRLVEISGREHQRQYLDGLRMQVEQEAANISERAGKLLAEQSRYQANTYRYRNKRFTQEQWDKRFGESRTARYGPLYDRYRRVGDTVYVFNDYDRAPWDNGVRDFLWWDVITDGRMDGNFIPEVREWRDSNPNYHYRRYSSSSSFSGSSSGSDSFFGATDPS